MARSQGERGGGRRGARVLLRAALILLALLLLAAILLLVFRRPVAERATEAALARAGVEAEVTIEALTTDRLVARIDADALTGAADIRFDLETLARERRIRTVTLRGVRATLRWSPEAGLRIDGLPDLGQEDGEGEGGGRLPFDVVTLEDASLRLVTPAGEGTARGSGRWDGEAGEGALTVSAARLGTAARAVSDLTAETAFELTGGRLTARAEGVGTVQADGVTARNLAFDGSAEGALATGVTGRFAFATDRVARGAQSASLTGVVDGSWQAGSLRLSAAEPVVIGLPDLTATLAPGADLDWSPAGWRAGGTLAAEGLADGDLVLAARQAPGDAIRFGVQGTLEGLRLAGVRAEGIAVTADGTVSDGVQARADVRAASAAHEASGAAASGLAGPVHIARDAEGTLTARIGEGCLTARRATLPGTALTGLRACEGSVVLSAEPEAGLSLAAESLRVAVSEDEGAVTGKGLSARAQLRGDEASWTARLASARAFGWVAADARVRGTAALGDAPSHRGEIERVRLAQDAETPALAPLVLSGPGRLADGVLRLDLSLMTEGEVPLGRAALTQDLRAGRGGLNFDGVPLAFAPDGLRLTQLIPALRGIVSEASGGAAASARALWGPDGLTTSGTLSLADLSFAGPTVAIARTERLSADIALDSLWPPRTAGVQGGTLGALDFGAVRLEGGAFRFALPGDDRVVIEAASFPWMDGTLSLDQTDIGFAGGGRAVVSLDGLSLETLLASVDVAGLSGEGLIDGTLPLAFDAFSVGIDGGRIESRGPGAIRYQGAAVAGAGGAAEGARIAFSALENLRFDKLSGTVDGPLAGTLAFGLRFEGRGDIDLGARAAERVTAPVIYRINLEAPLLGLIDQARLSTDTRRQIREGRRQIQEGAEEVDPADMIEANPDIF